MFSKILFNINSVGEAQIVENFLNILYVQRDEKALKSLLSTNVKYTGPSGSYSTAEDYINKVATRIPDRLIDRIHIQKLICEGVHVAAFYECFSKRVEGESLAFAEWFIVENQLIQSIHICFDTRPFIEFL